MQVGTVAHHLVVPLVIVMSLNTVVIGFLARRRRKAGLPPADAPTPILISLIVLFIATCLAAILAR